MRDEFLITRQGKQYVLFAGLLDEAHARGLRSIDTDLIQVPDDSNGQVAVVKATVHVEDPANPDGGLRTFSGIGDASPENVSRNIVPHLIRMAETRAKARALRDAVNVGATALEELSDGDDSGAQQRSSPSSGSSGGSPAASSAQRPPRGLQDASRSRPRTSSGSRTPETGPRPVEGNGQAQPQASGSPESPGSSGKSGKARKSQVDLLRTLAEELRGEKGVERLEGRIGKTLSELTRAEADEWIDRLTPEGRE